MNVKSKIKGKGTFNDSKFVTPVKTGVHSYQSCQKPDWILPMKRGTGMTFLGVTGSPSLFLFCRLLI